MERKIYLTNSLSRKKELFVPINKGMVGLYVCGPTVYGDPHLGHARPGITYDILVRLFRFLGYKVRYVRNITDVGHLVGDVDFGEDKIAAKAKLEQLEPMEIAQIYTLSYHEAMRKLNTLPPSIEPRASGHIMEQIDLVQHILDNGYAYESNGSIYFDVLAYNKKYNYGILSGRKVEDLIANTRVLDGQSDKKSPVDFALWKKAAPEHIMKWKSPWSLGFPGWHAECSAMSAKYLGDEFDIHGGGMDLLFPHHECEIAQNTAARGKNGVHYWIHNNMVTINGQKMGKSLGNFITLNELFNGTHKALERAYSPMTVRFFILQAHYRSTLDFSNSALQAAEKGLKRMLNAMKDVKKLSTVSGDDVNENIVKIQDEVMSALCDDLNTPIALSYLFDAVKIVNQVKDGSLKITEKDKINLTTLLVDINTNVLGLVEENTSEESESVVNGLVNIILDVRKDSKEKKDFSTSDLIRDRLNQLGIQIKDTKDGAEWSMM